MIALLRLDTLDDLDAIEELKDASELKNKLLFSVVVVSQSCIDRMRGLIRSPRIPKLGLGATADN